MWCSLERLCQARGVTTGLGAYLCDFHFTVRIFVFLEPPEQLRLSHASLVVFFDRAELSLYATAIRLELEWLTTYSVCTPPLAAW